MFLNNSTDETKFINGSTSVLIGKISLPASFPIPEVRPTWGDRTKSQKMHIVTFEHLMATYLSSDQQNYDLLILKFPLFLNKSSFSVRLLLADLLYMLRIGSKILLVFFAFDGQSKNA